MRFWAGTCHLSVLLCAAALAVRQLPATCRAADLHEVVERFEADRRDMLHEYGVPYAPSAARRLEQFYRQWDSELRELKFDDLPRPAKIDYLLLHNYIRRAMRQLEFDEQEQQAMEPLAPFLGEITELETARRRCEFVDGRTAAEQLSKLAGQVADVRADVEKRLSSKDDKEGAGFDRTTGRQAALAVGASVRTLSEWHDFYHGYDPVVTWWIAAPYQQLRSDLESYAAYLRREVAGIKEGDDDTILGRPIGKQALESELAAEMIPYDPERLIKIADREFAWCQEQMIDASRALGYGDDWKAAMEHVKRQFVPPGEQPRLIRELHEEAVQFLEVRNLLTIPPLAKESWGMEMMSAERQRVNPFFLGGESIIVSYPTDEMSHEDKLMSMRGNNRHFARATVFHELIPGHRLQAYMQARHRPHRRLFSTPFWTEGWALYWEMQMWDLGFPETPEQRIGMLFWRMHRCARIIFSLRFHLGEMTAEECVDFLVERVGHERQNAAGEVRRSFEGDYSPLYQAAYMLGGLQLRALHRELVESGKMTPREFHDAVLKENCMPIALLRASLTGEKLNRDFEARWRFDD